MKFPVFLLVLLGFFAIQCQSEINCKHEGEEDVCVAGTTNTVEELLEQFLEFMQLWVSVFYLNFKPQCFVADKPRSVCCKRSAGSDL